MSTMSLIILILGLLFFVGLVIIHELGHFWVARRNGVKIKEFGIGFPPLAKVLAKKNGTSYTLNWLPLGGFVRLKGEYDSDTEPGSFGAASLSVKLKIAAAGVFMNLVAAAIILTIIAFIGMPKSDLQRLPFYDKEQFSVVSDSRILKNQVLVAVIPDSPASIAGLEDGDEIISIAGKKIVDAEALPQLTEELKGQTAEIVISRDNQIQSVQADLQDKRSDQFGYLGVAPINRQVFRATWSAPIVGVMTTLQFTDLSFRGLGFVISSLFAGQADVASSAVGGPVGTIAILNDLASEGLSQVLFLIALISISLAVMNILPIPALDGGRIFVLLLFRALRRKLTKRQEDLIHGTGFVLLIGLIMLITVIDIRRLI